MCVCVCVCGGVGMKAIHLVPCVKVGNENNFLIFSQNAKYFLTQCVITVTESIKLVLWVEGHY